MTYSRRFFQPGLLLPLAVLLVLPAALSANDLVNFTTVPSTDFAVFGAGGMRGQGTGSIVVTGVSGTVTKAFIFWHGPTSGNDANATVTFNGSSVTGVNIGISNNNCWGFTDSRAYRADVTSLVTGDGTYTLANFRKPSSGDDVNGVSLVIFFNDGNPANNRDVVIFNGNDSNQPNTFDAIGWNATLSGINYTSGTVNALFIVSDGQGFPDEAVVINGQTILPACSSPNWQGNTVPDQGTASSTGGGLWDQKSLNLTSLFSPGPNTLIIQPQSSCSDCLSLIAVLFDLPAGAAPGTCKPPAAPSLSVDTPVANIGQTVTLSWNETIASGKGKYTVQVSINGGGFFGVGSVAANGPGTATFSYVPGAPGTYDFRVLAVAGSCSSTSNVAEVIAAAACPQGPVVKGVAVNPSSAAPGETFTLTWDRPGGFSGGFGVFESTDGGATFHQIGTTSGTSFTGTVPGLTGTTLTFEVEVLGCIYTQKSNFATLTVGCDPPGEVTDIKIEAFGVLPSRPPSPTEFMVVSWTAPAGGTTPIRYGVRINGDPEVLVVGTSIVLPPRGTADPITAFVTAYACARLISAELYDPGTGLWNVTGNLALPRQAHTGTLLDDGRVLVAGGVASVFTAPTPTSELYDPTSGTWASTGTLQTPRDLHAATAISSSQSGSTVLAVLANSEILVEGGFGSQPLGSSELYKPSSGTWSAVGDLATARYLQTATLLNSGKVLVVGGLGSGPLSSAELYDPAAKSWTATGSLAAARYRHTATLLPDGKVLVAGGLGVPGALSSAEVYDPAAGVWTSTGGLAVAREGHSAVLLSSGKVLVAGGDDGAVALSSAELYDPAAGAWTATGNLVTARRGHTATLLAGGKVLIASGFGATLDKALKSAELYEPVGGTFASTGSLNGSHGVHTATLLGTGKVLVAGFADVLGTEVAGPTVSSAPVALFLEPPVASFTISANPQAGVPVTFTDTSSPQATSWLWIFDDGTTDTHQSPTHTFTTAGTHQVSLIASNGAGSSTATQSFVVAAAGTAGTARAVAISSLPIDSSDPGRRRARVEIAGPNVVLLRLRGLEAGETIVFLRFLGESGKVISERRLSVQAGAEAAYDLGAYGLRGGFGIELVSNQKFESTLWVVGRPSVREIHR